MTVAVLMSLAALTGCANDTSGEAQSSPPPRSSAPSAPETASEPTGDAQPAPCEVLDLDLARSVLTGATLSQEDQSLCAYSGPGGTDVGLQLRLLPADQYDAWRTAAEDQYDQAVEGSSPIEDIEVGDDGFIVGGSSPVACFKQGDSLAIVIGSDGMTKDGVVALSEQIAERL